MEHFANNGKEYLKKDRQYRSNQGRSPEDEEKIYKGCFWITLIFIVCVCIFALYNIIL